MFIKKAYGGCVRQVMLTQQHQHAPLILNTAKLAAIRPFSKATKKTMSPFNAVMDRLGIPINNN